MEDEATGLILVEDSLRRVYAEGKERSIQKTLESRTNQVVSESNGRRDDND